MGGVERMEGLGGWAEELNAFSACIQGDGILGGPRYWESGRWYGPDNVSLFGLKYV